MLAYGDGGPPNAGSLMEGEDETQTHLMKVGVHALVHQWARVELPGPVVAVEVLNAQRYRLECRDFHTPADDITREHSR